MLALARALMSHPRMLLLDEPSLGLAPLVTREIFRIVGELNEKEGLTVLVVEQSAAIALEVASYAYVLEVGKVAVSGPSEARAQRVRPQELPGVLRVAEFFQQVVAGLATEVDLLRARAGARAHPPRRRRDQLRAGQMAMFTTYIAWTLTASHGWIVLARLRGDARARVPARLRDPARRDPPDRAGVDPDDGDRDDRPGADLQRPRRPDRPAVRAFEPVPERHLGDRRRRDLAAGRRHARGRCS